MKTCTRRNLWTPWSTGKSGLKPVPTVMMAVGLMITGGIESAQGATAYWWGTTSDKWSENNWSSTDASSSAVFTSYTPVDNDQLNWYYNATSNTTSINDKSGFTVALLDFRRAKSAITLKGNPLTLTGNVSYGGGQTIDLDLISNVAYLTLGAAKGDIVGTAPPLTINGKISEIGGARNVSSGGPLYLNGANSFTGLFTASGTIYLNTLANNDTAQSLGQGTVQFGSGAESNSGTIIYSGGATSTNKPFRIGRLHQSTGNLAGGAFLNNGTGAVVWTGPQALASSIDAPRTFTLGGTNDDDNHWQSAIADNDPDCPVSFKKIGAGKWILSGLNSYSGTTTVEGGTLLINGDQSGATGAVTVSADATLGGSGTLGGALTVHGDLSPGASTGILTVNDNVAFASGSTFVVEINGTTVGLEYDQLVVNGAVTVDNATLAINWGYTPMAGDVFTLIQATAGVAGTFVGLPDGAEGIANGQRWVISYADGQIVIMAIPEPTSLALLGLAGLSALRRRSRKA